MTAAAEIISLPTLQLTRAQREASEQIINHLRGWSSARKVLVLSGYAGTGKTTLVAESLRRMTTRSMPIMIAPTHKACRVIRSKIERAGVAAEVLTMSRALGYTYQVNPTTGAEEFLPPAPERLGESLAPACWGERPVIVDECSMIGREHWTDFMACVRQLGLVVLAMGDPYQLPPIGEVMSDAFGAGEMIKLTEVMRSAGVLTEVVLGVRQAIASGTCGRIERSAVDAQGIVAVHPSSEEFLAALIADLRAGVDAMAVAYTNRAVSWLNDRCRRAVVGDSTDPFVAGERLVALYPFGTTPIGGRQLTTEQRFWIEEARPGAHRVKCPLSGRHELACWRLTIRTDEGRVHACLPIMDAEQSRALGALVKRLGDEAKRLPEGEKKRKLWEARADLRASVIRARPSYATTAHKSQGSTWDHVYVAQGDICRNTNLTERNKLLYVAASRAARELHVCG